MLQNYQFDKTDFRILNLLLENANLPYTAIAEKVFVSNGTVHVRMERLKRLGIVEGAELKINYHLLGWDITAFIGIYLDKSSLYEEAVEALEQIPEVVNLHYTTGSYSIFAKIICRDTNHLREVLNEKIQKVRGIQRTETFISLEERLNRPLILS
ncbi:MAG: Lrp/AsnC ligand binding domain-containing protein [Thermonemataceae bacterium]|nr:Lrp/AsnC ligand binding domain-containing protein [Thermonemataceae bacterium]